jgi:hypothetical protein
LRHSSEADDITADAHGPGAGSKTEHEIPGVQTIRQNVADAHGLAENIGIPTAAADSGLPPLIQVSVTFNAVLPPPL